MDYEDRVITSAKALLSCREGLRSFPLHLLPLFLDGVLAVLVLVELVHGQIQQNPRLDPSGKRLVNRRRDGDEQGSPIQVVLVVSPGGSTVVLLIMLGGVGLEVKLLGGRFLGSGDTGSEEQAMMKM